jgi:hypothetical protein
MHSAPFHTGGKLRRATAATLLHNLVTCLSSCSKPCNSNLETDHNLPSFVPATVLNSSTSEVMRVISFAHLFDVTLLLSVRKSAEITAVALPGLLTQKIINIVGLDPRSAILMCLTFRLRSSSRLWYVCVAFI